MNMWLKQFNSSHFYLQLTRLLDAYFSQLPVEIEEYRLIQSLEKAGCFNGLNQYPSNLSLYAKHFLTRHGLYYLLPQLNARNISVDFSLMRIHFFAAAAPSLTKSQYLVDGKNALLADFYGDLSILENSTESSVQKLLIDFWQQYSAYQAAESSLALLQLPPEAKWQEIQLAYRRLAAKYHPDKGGEAHCFTELQQAYESLKCIHAPKHGLKS